jgi:hypothetical protein
MSAAASDSCCAVADQESNPPPGPDLCRALVVMFRLGEQVVEDGLDAVVVQGVGHAS